MSEPTDPEQPAPSPPGWRKKTDPNQITQADMEFAADLKLQGEPPETIHRRLIERGLSEEAAGHLITALFTSQPSTGKQVVCKMIGGPVFVIGILLLIGNVTGMFVTFPFAGFIVMASAARFGVPAKRADRQRRPFSRPRQRSPRARRSGEISSLPATIGLRQGVARSPVSALYNSRVLPCQIPTVLPSPVTRIG